MKKLKNTRGITLIALVVTIVVLLILAAISISMLGGENGIITRAIKSKDETEQGKVEEIVDLAINTLISENQGSTNGITPKDIADKINSEYSEYENVYAEDESNFPTKIIFPEENNREVDVDLNGSTSTGDSDKIYNADISDEDIAPLDIFEYETISDAETGATSLDSLPTKEARITRLNPKYCNSQDTNYEIELEDGKKITDTLVIPYQVEIDGEMYKITKVNLAGPRSAYEYGGQLPKVKTIIFPNTVKEISSGQGEGGITNESVSEIILPQNLKTIDDYTFANCNNLTNIEIPNSVTSIGDKAFQHCSNLANIRIPSSITIIGERTFYYCTNLTSIEIPSGLTTIEDEAFSGCRSLIDIEIPSSVTSIGGEAFLGCSSLTGIEIPSGVTRIESSTFYRCSSLTNIIIPSSVTSMGMFSFSGCSSLTSINIPSSVTSIENSAFDGCSSLNNIIIPSSVTSIGISVFENCSSLTSIEILGDVPSIGNTMFSGCSSLTSINIPSSVTSIENCAFEGCSNLTSINIPTSVTSIKNAAFDGCSSLKTVNYAGTKIQWKGISITSYGNTSLKNAQIICTDGTI